VPFFRGEDLEGMDEQYVSVVECMGNLLRKDINNAIK
jgi:hypothetical protein